MKRIERTLIRVFLAFIICSCVQCSRETDGSLISREVGSSNNELPADTSVLALSADLLYTSDRYLEASEEYGKLIKIDSFNGKFFYRKAYCLLQIDSPYEASEYYLKASSLGYRVAECYYAMGGIHNLSGSDSLAILYLRKALSLAPDMEKAKTLLWRIKGYKSSI